MFLRFCLHKPVNHRFPRVRGDVPYDFLSLNQSPRFSPRARGCSFTEYASTGATTVFPACAGMFLAAIWDTHQVAGFPRVRGDVPFIGQKQNALRQFSPRARGCSLRPHRIEQ